MEPLPPFPDHAATPEATNPAAHGRRPASFAASDRSRFERILQESASPPRDRSVGSDGIAGRGEDRSMRPKEAPGGKGPEAADEWKAPGAEEPLEPGNAEGTADPTNSAATEETKETEGRRRSPAAAAPAAAATAGIPADPVVTAQAGGFPKLQGGSGAPDAVSPPGNIFPDDASAASLSAAGEGEASSATPGSHPEETAVQGIAQAGETGPGTGSKGRKETAEILAGKAAGTDGAGPAEAAKPKQGPPPARHGTPGRTSADEAQAEPDAARRNSLPRAGDAAAGFEGELAGPPPSRGPEASGEKNESSAARRAERTDGNAVPSAEGSRVAVKEAAPEPPAAPPKAVRFGEHEFVIRKKSDASVEVSLSPPGVGKLEIEVALEKGVVNARITAADPAGREAIARNLPQIVEALARDGMNIGGFTVSLKERRDRPREASGAEGRAESRAGAPSAATAAVPAAAASAGLVDIIV